MIKKTLPYLLATLFYLLLSSSNQAQDSISISFGNLWARSIGPAVMSGRIADIDGVDKSPEIFYVGAANGGVWKTITAGASFDAVFDEHIQSIGDICIDQSNPDTVWVGTGEPWVRNSVSVGNGIYRTRNGGKTWEHLGLDQTERIAKVLVHPTNSATIYVAAQGHLWNANPERGVYKTEDFGNTWQLIKFVDENTGCADLTIDPLHPDTLIAAFWDHRRSPDFFRSGGPGSGLYKTYDGGKNWKKISTGLPEGQLGRMAVEYAPSDPSIVYLTVECDDKTKKGLYRSNDGGESFQFVNGDFGNTVRPFYFSRLTVDPNNSEKIFKCGLDLTISENGGEAFRTVGSGVHSDIHAVWVPENLSKYVIIGTDGGGYRSLDGGHSFEMFMNLPLSQFYHVSVDDDIPFNVYGGLQDNGSWFGPSSAAGGIDNADWLLSNWGDGFYSFRHPTDPNVIYSESQGGNIVRFDKRDGQSKDIKPLPVQGDPKFRFNWNAPIHLSTHNPDRLYFGAQFLFKSENRGDSWQRISPDLTSNDSSRQQQAKSGGLSIDNSTAENNTTIYAISESPVNEQIIWVGTDDGFLQVTRDGGENWSNVTPNINGLPPFTWCSYVEASPHKENVAFVTFDGHKQGDKATYVYRTDDYGQSWNRISHAEIDGYAHVIRQDLVNPDLLFLGTEFGLFISLDGGKSWKQFDNNLPGVSVRAMAIHARDHALVIATHGRGIYIIDDITPLRKITPGIVDNTLTFLELPPSVIKLPKTGRPFGGAGNFVGENPSQSALIAYYMKKRHTFGRMTLEVLDEEGNLIKELPAGKSGGINIVELPLRLPPPKAAPTKNRMALAGSLITPALLEGTYQVKITKGKEVFTHEITLAPDAQSIHSRADRDLQQKTLKILYDLTNELGYTYFALEDMQTSASEIKTDETGLKQELNDFVSAVKNYKESLVSLEGDFYVDEGEALREEISTLYYSISRYPGKPSVQQIEKTQDLEKQFMDVREKFSEFKLTAENLNKKLLEKNLAPIYWRSMDEYLN
ncbi:MAG: hypothetical protein KDC80_04505 [Saprospiraceae bacterium]|nr:hypothetical protein [Saprospiraceae bacterium]